MARSDRAFPSGLVTFAFTDIEGSTQLFRRIGDRYPVLLERHREILRAAWGESGWEVKTEGDSFFVAFADPIAAISACVRAQRELTAEPWPDDASIRVRMGLHTGLASPHGDDYIALAVHQASRVVDAAHGGQIVVSAATAEQITGPARGMMRSLGRYRVRDFDEPVELLQATAPGLAAAFPPLRVLPADRHNLVAAPTTIIGREGELGVLADLVATARLVTVVGPGGLGKTRLVTEFGMRAAAEMDHGVWFVDLAPLNDPNLIVPTVAEAVAAPTSAALDPTAAVIEHLRGRRAMVIMDNCEHLVAGVAKHVDELLRGCPLVSVVATSRAPLGLGGERIWRLAPLDYEAALQLFCDRAGFTGRLDPTLRTTLVELCRLLDGLPLAIELAAARCDVLAPADIVARLGGRAGFLHSDDPTVSARQRSLDATIEWSCQLLHADEQLTFRRLGVFAAGFGLEAPCAAVAADDIDPYDVPELIWSLVSKSLVVKEPAAGSTRYRMLDTVRVFAQRQLAESGELANVALRLAGFFLDSYGPQLEKTDVQLLAQRSRDIDNVRPLIPIVAPHDEELAQELACMVVVDSRRASPGAGGDEGLRLLDQLPARTPARVALLAEVVVLSSDHGLVDRAAALLDETQLLAAEVGTPPWLDGRIDQFRGILALQRGDAHAARAIAEAALQRTSSWRGRSRLLNLLCMAAMEEGRPDDARSAAESALEISTRLGQTEARAVDLGNLAELEMLAGDPRAAARRQLECLEVALQLGSLRDVTSAWILAARLAAAISDWTIATSLQGAADAAMERIGLALYPPDRELCDKLLAAAPSHIGAASFDSLIAASRTLSLTEATAHARKILAIVADAGPPPPADA